MARTGDVKGAIALEELFGELARESPLRLLCGYSFGAFVGDGSVAAFSRVCGEHADIDPASIDLVIAATTTPDGLFPSVASLIQDKLGARTAGAFDVNAACVGFLSAFAAATQFVAVNFILTFPGDDPFASLPVATLLPPGVSSYTPLHPGEYDLYLIESANLTTVKGPLRINAAAGGIYSVLAIDGPDTATADTLFLDDPQ